MPKIASILACFAMVSLFSLETQALPGSSVSAQGVTTQVILVKGYCGRGYHHRRSDGACVPYAGPQAFGLPYAELPSVRLPYAELPAVRLPYAELPPVRLPYVELPAVRLPYVEPPAVGLPYVELPVVGTPHACPNGYSYYVAYRRCVPI